MASKSVKQTVDELEAAVEPMNEVVPAIVKLCDDFGNAFIENKNQPERIETLGNAIKAHGAAIAAAIVKHTPADPAEPPDPGPTPPEDPVIGRR